MCGVTIRKMAYSEIEQGLNLIWKVFQEFVAPNYSQEGIDYFYEEYIAGKRFQEKFASGKEMMYGAYLDRRLVGVLSVSVKNTVSCVFVDGNYHKMGIGKKLFDAVVEQLRSAGAVQIRLNASPYAVPFYHSLGFQDLGEQTSYKGILYTPMKLLL